MKLLLIRPNEPMMRHEGYTLGFMYIDGHPFCFTCEDTVRPPGIKIQDKTAIPAGTYKIILSFSPHFGKVLPELLSVNLFQNIRIHQGNSEFDTSGCILVGDSIHITDDKPLRDSIEALDHLMLLMDAAAERHEDVTIEIKNSFN
jgi:hypothetical protein